MQSSIQLKDISYHFDETDKQVSLFENLNMVIKTGSSYTIVGPSGAGKSSLLTLAAGLDKPKRGEVQFILNGIAATEQQVRENSGFIFQQFHLLPELDAIGNLALPLRLKGDKSALEKASHWLEKVGLQDRAKHKPNQLSGGEQQRIAIARAFVSEPKFIFADEPTGNLDQKTSQEISNLMFEFSASNECAMVVVTHSQELASQADHLFRLSDGKLEMEH